MDGIRSWIEAEGTGHWFFVAFPVVLVCLFIWFKGRRVRFLIPSLIISIVIINPLFFKYWDNLGLYAYWRILWVVPVIPIVASLVPSLTERIRKTWVKSVVAAAGVGAVVIGGTFIYNGAGGSFTVAANASKEPDYVVQIADRLLELDDHPRVIAQDPIGVYLRQYSGQIDTLFGRDLHGYVTGGASANATTVNNEINNPESNLSITKQFMVDDGFDYLVTTKELDDGFDLVDRFGEYAIYTVTGRPTVLKKRNELGQIVSITTVDENGHPINNVAGYSTVSYEYDNRGNVVREFRSDTYGNGVTNEKGFAGFEREFTEQGRIIMERTIGINGEPIINNLGFAECRREYRGRDLISESYYDENGIPTNRTDLNYAKILLKYDAHHNKIEEHYYSTEGIRISSIYGYASLRRTFDENDRITSVSYYGSDEQLVLCSNGYASEDMKYDSRGNLVRQRFFGADNQLVVGQAGYAVVRREYNDTGKLINEAYFDESEMPIAQLAGHTAIRQTWEGNNLISRLYLNSAGESINRVDGYSEVIWNQDEKGIWNVNFFNIDGDCIGNTGINLVKDIRTGADGWSEWITPSECRENYIVFIGDYNLGKKDAGDMYMCQLEIEFSNVSTTEEKLFRFWTVGSSDGSWNIENIWNSDLMWVGTVPEDGIYKYEHTFALKPETADASFFRIGFRCDYWAAGSFRVRNVMIQHGEMVSEWSPGL